MKVLETIEAWQALAAVAGIRRALDAPARHQLARDDLGDGEEHEEDDEERRDQVENILDTREPAIGSCERGGKWRRRTGGVCFHQRAPTRKKCRAGPVGGPARKLRLTCESRDYWFWFARVAVVMT